jgi:formate-dependent nitrite reductase membrane component NrfD
MNIKTARQWMVPHEWMIKPTQQTEWIDGRGVLVWLAEVFSALGTGLYLVSVFTNNWWGALFGWIMIVAFKLPLHLVYLGKPWRFWRAIPPFTNAWRTSWMARGMFFTMLFALFGVIQLVTTYLLVHHVLAASAVEPIRVVDYIFRTLGGIFAVATGIYIGFAMSYCKGVAFWNTGLLPIIFVVDGVAAGLALIIAKGLVSGGVDITGVEAAGRIAIIVNALLILSYLVNASYQSTAGGVSVRELVVGRVAAAFWAGIVVLGIAVPLAISFVSLFAGEASSPLLIIAVVSHTIGAFALKYCVLKVGIYRPLLPRACVY